MTTTLATGPRSEVTAHERTAWDIKQGRGSSRTWQRVIGGQQYSFTAVLMPDGERRYLASRFNGYSGGPRFACAWTPCGSWTVASA